MIALFSACGQDNTKQNTEPDPTTLQDKYSYLLQLPESFADCTESNPSGYTFLFSDGRFGIGGYHIQQDPAIPLDDCAMLEADSYRAELTQKDGFWTFTYEDTDSNEPQTIVSVCRQTEEGYYWIIQGYCPSESYAEYESEIWSYITGGQPSGE